MLRNHFVGVLEARTEGELLREIVKFAHDMDFSFVNAFSVFESPGKNHRVMALNNFSMAYNELATDPESFALDPVLQHVKHSCVPIVYDRDTYYSVGLHDDWDAAAAHGVGPGLAVPFHTPDGNHAVFGLTRDKDLQGGRKELIRIVSETQLFASFVQQAMFGLWMPVAATEKPTELTLRELECLRWTMEGKTAWEVGKILHISERTANHYLNRAQHKLECLNKHQAVIKALRAGLIQ